jgi:uncharacterized protein YprB with RNaseH-like and TPR domain
MSKRTGEEQKRLRERLSRLGKQTGRRTSPPSMHDVSKSAKRFGNPLETPHGLAFIIEERFPLDHTHGNRQLQEYFGYSAQLAAEIARDASLAEVDLDHMLFVDTETTGLVGGAGTIAFLIGIGAFEQDEFVLRQFFLHDPGEEAAMLHLLSEQIDSAVGFISFNGRVFDIPLMEMRFRMGLRKRLPLTTWPHLDLLFPARRLWRRALPDCSLGTLEKNILGVQRSDEDVPGAWIPGMYLDYLRTGDLTDLKRVVYHNMIDILSLVGLSVEILNRHDDDSATALTGAEALGLARWHEGAGRGASAENAFLAAIESKDEYIRLEALRYWTAHLKRSGERVLAVQAWEQWHQLAQDDPRPCVELAKYYEWHAKDLVSAAYWSQQALLCLSHWPDDWRREQTWGEIEHRIARIAKKRAREDSVE